MAHRTSRPIARRLSAYRLALILAAGAILSIALLSGAAATLLSDVLAAR